MILALQGMVTHHRAASDRLSEALLETGSQPMHCHYKTILVQKTMIYHGDNRMQPMTDSANPSCWSQKRFSPWQDDMPELSACQYSDTSDLWSNMLSM